MDCWKNATTISGGVGQLRGSLVCADLKGGLLAAASRNWDRQVDISW
jgi:hypothetical protein